MVQASRRKCRLKKLKWKGDTKSTVAITVLLTASLAAQVAVVAAEVAEVVSPPLNPKKMQPLIPHNPPICVSIAAVTRPIRCSLPFQFSRQGKGKVLYTKKQKLGNVTSIIMDLSACYNPFQNWLSPNCNLKLSLFWSRVTEMFVC